MLPQFTAVNSLYPEGGKYRVMSSSTIGHVGQPHGKEDMLQPAQGYPVCETYWCECNWSTNRIECAVCCYWPATGYRFCNWVQTGEYCF